MMRRKQPQAAASAPALGAATPPQAAVGELSDAARFLQSMQDPEIIERVRTTIPNAHVFKLPPRQSASVGWRGADWKEKVWQGTVKVVERLDQTAVLLVDRTKGSIFAVCPVKEGAVDRCVDSSRYFVLRIENANGRHMFIGVAFNERNDAFDFNTALEDSRREREMEKQPVKAFTGPAKDYSIKEGEKIRVSIPKGSLSASGHKKSKGGTPPSLLKPCSKDTPRRTSPVQHESTTSKSNTPPESNSSGLLGSFFSSTAENTDPFPSSAFGGTNFFATNDDESTESKNPFFNSSSSNTKEKSFDPRNYKTEPTR
jgi:hypothetical protein